MLKSAYPAINSEPYYTGWDHSLKICKFEKDDSILKLKLFTLTD